MWQAALDPGMWLRADAQFKAGSGEEDGEAGRWHKNKPLPETWPLKVLGVTVLGRLTSFRHLGLFPEQLPHWQWMLERLARGARRDAPRPQSLRLHGGRLADRGPGRGRGDARRRLQAGDRLGQAEPGRLQAGRGADPLDPRRRAQVRGPRGAARQELPRHPRRSPQVRARARGRGVGRVPAPGPAAARLRSPAGAGAGVAGADELCHPRLGAGDRRPRARMPRRASGHDRERRAGRGGGGRRAAAADLATSRDGPRAMPPPDPQRAACAPSPACRTSA